MPPALAQMNFESCRPAKASSGNSRSRRDPGSRYGFAPPQRCLCGTTTGQIIGTFGISRDITSYLQAEEALNQERDRLQTLMNHLPDVIFIKDTSGRFLMANPALVKLYGAESPEDLIGRKDEDFIPQSVADHFVARRSSGHGVRRTTGRSGRVQR